MTEEEAKQRWCPFARVGYEQTTFNRFNNPANAIASSPVWPAICNCIGSKCMAWRWEYDDYRATGGGLEQTDSGYCGLAGKP